MAPSPRKPADLPVELQFKKDGPRTPGEASDITMAGMFIKCDETPPEGTPVLVYLQTMQSDVETMLPSLVRWVRPNGIGVQFMRKSERDVYALMEIVAAIDRVTKRKS